MVAAIEAIVETDGVEGKVYRLVNSTASLYVIALYLLGPFPFFPIRMLISLFRIVKVLAPMLAKLLLMEDFRMSIEVSVPTKEVIPIKIISAVMMVRKSCDLMARSDIRMFSLRNEAMVELYCTKLIN